MSDVSQYVVILIAYFTAMVGIGIWFNKRSRSRSEYFLARGKLGPATIGISFSATQISGSSYMGAVGTERLLGYNFSPAGVSSAAAPWFSYILLGDRLRRVASRLGSVTLADVLQARFYSKWVGAIATSIMLVAFVPLIAAQLKAAANVFEVLLGMPYWVGLVGFGGVVVLYTVLGGMLAVAWTDFVQGLIMMAGFAILAPMAVYSAGGFSEMHRQYGALNPQAITLVGKMPALWVISDFLAWGFFQIGGSPAAVTRFLIPEDDRTLKGAMAYSVVFQSFIYVCATLIAIASGVLLPDLEQPDLTLPTLVAKLLPPVFGGIIIAAVLSAIMSTLSGILLVAGSLTVENVYVKLIGRTVSAREGLRIARWVTFVIGALAMAMAIRPPAAIFWIVTMSFSFMASAFTFPFLLGLWWPRATREGGLAGMLGGALACVAWYVLGYWRYGTLEDWIGGLWPAFFGPMVSLVLMVVVSKLTAPAPEEVLETFFAGLD
ncbi:MAG TPA: sodium/solute symporter [Vicinamibacteria bacterium]|nr:sodium/solute symporter [Vicinamibacteria bacterium]